MSGAPPVLVARGVQKRFGGVVALGGVDLDVRAGRVQAVIGPNGSGKTTLLNCLSGAYRADAGSVRLDTASLLGRKPNRIARLGLARTFQTIRLFGSLSVLDNVKVAVGAHLPRAGLFGGAARERAIDARAEAALVDVGLEDRRADIAAALPYAQQRLLEIARAVAAAPKVLLLDEPAAGMNMTEALRLLDLVAALRARGLTILLVEHNMRLVMGISDDVTVLDFGKVIARGTPSAVQADPAVIEAYLGRKAARAGARA